MRSAVKPTTAITASRLFGLLLAGSAIACAASAHATPFLVTNLVTDSNAALALVPAGNYGPAVREDLNLVNPWGISHSGNQPFWVSNAETGTSTLYPVTAAGLGTNSTVVVIPPPGVSVPVPPGTPPSHPTGQVTTAGTGASEFMVPNVPGAPATMVKSGFIFATEDGTLAARTAGNFSITVVDNSASGAVYKGLAIGQATIGGKTGSFLYAANFHSGEIDVFDGSFSPVSVPAGTFTDPDTAPGGLYADYAPFNVQTLNGKLYVTYAKRDPANPDEDDPGAGNGFVDVFNLDGTSRQRVTSGGVLNSPWGLDIAPLGFGEFALDLLIGNFGDGTINVFDPISGGLLGTFHDLSGNPIVIDGLWALSNGTGTGNGGLADTVYFTAGIGGEEHGLFGSIRNVPEPSTIAMFGIGLLGLGFMMRRRALASQ